MTIVVNMSDAKVAGGDSASATATPATADAVLATYSLGSCIGVSLYDPVTKVGGMLHYQLPSASLDADKAKANPCMFADTGMQYLLDKMAKAGAEKRRLKVKIAGAAQMLNDNSMFSIGKRNHAAIRKILWQAGLFIDAEHVGGSQPRHFYLNVADGAVTVKAAGETQQL